ncbi:helix-turn-helix domain-containing protein [Actinomadura rupiterrae]|uniref:helix-turn-helix domain-containing protein n=1 Tax=Actinomadura rupiterrae TaxID=559627 RepID=UPI0020A339A1|nr:helix-turn-helix transcriptional regulator [Actinomadura rupiterrae]MCP2343059.1 transcriptional regulator with XRE-family HTH domain [Actinomadura rupiterrae]
MSEQANAARKAFAERLRDIRRDAGHTGLELAARTGINNARISRIEHGKAKPTEDDIRKWAIACGVARLIPELIPELIAVHREVEQMWLEHRREMRKGQVHIQSRSGPLYEDTELLRVYESTVVPGILQTPRYARDVLRINAAIHGLPFEDVERAAAARTSRQHLVTAGTGRNRYFFLVEASVLTFVHGGPEVMEEQLDLLSSVATRPNVVLGIIPPGRRKVWAGEAFYLFDERLVRSGYWSGAFRTRRPDDIALYLKIFEMQRQQAVFGGDARALIQDARGALQNWSNS